MYNGFVRFVLIQCIVLSIAACGGSSVKAPPVADYSIQKKTDIMNEALMLSAASRQTNGDDYLIGPEDILEIEAFNVEELKKTLRVNSTGVIALPLIGIIKVEGMTTSGVEQLITKKLEKYVEETVVNVFVKEYKSQRISVIGAVEKPHVFAVTGQRYVIDMLMMAGGIRNDAGKICYVIRPEKTAGPDNTAGNSMIVIDLDELLINGNLSLNIPVFAGDVINVPKGGIFFVDGAINTPGAYTMKGQTTLVQAISMAKGVNSNAVMDDIRIFRDNGNGDRDIIIADYGAMKKGKEPDIFLAENDIIIVPRSGIKKFFNGFISTIKGFVSFGSYPIF